MNMAISTDGLNSFGETERKKKPNPQACDLSYSSGSLMKTHQSYATTSTLMACVSGIDGLCPF